MKDMEFKISDINYIIRINPQNPKYKEIVYKNSLKRVKNQKQIIRDFGIDVPTNANIMNTHQAIELLIKKIIKK